MVTALANQIGMSRKPSIAARHAQGVSNRWIAVLLSLHQDTWTEKVSGVFLSETRKRVLAPFPGPCTWPPARKPKSCLVKQAFNLQDRRKSPGLPPGLLPAEDSQGDCEGQDAPEGEREAGAGEFDQRLAFQHDPPQGVVERGEGQGADEWLHRLGESVG